MSLLLVFGRHASHASRVLDSLRTQATLEQLTVLRRVRDHIASGRRVQDLPDELRRLANEILADLFRARPVVAVDDVLSANGRGFLEPALHREYQASLARLNRTVDDLPPRDWIDYVRRHGSDTVAARLVQFFLGAGDEALASYRNLGSIARPATLDETRLTDLVGRLRADLPALGDRLDNMIEEIRRLPGWLRTREQLRLNEGHLRILAGNAGEILARQDMLRILRGLQREGAVLLTGARYRPPGPGDRALLFIDGILAEFGGGTMNMLGRIEVKNMRNADAGIVQHIEASELRMGSHDFFGTAEEAAAMTGHGRPDAVVLDPQHVRVWTGSSTEGTRLADDLTGQYYIGTAAGPGRRVVNTQTSRRHVIIPGGWDPQGASALPIAVRTEFDRVAGELLVHHGMDATYDELFYLLTEAVDLLKRHHGL